MKMIRDLTVTSAPYRGVSTQAPWHSAWASPITQTAPGLVLDFAAGIFGAGGAQSSMDTLVSLQRSGKASFINSSGLIETSPVNQSRLTHDPATLGRLGLLIERNRQNLLLGSDVPVDQSVEVTNVGYVLSFYGSGSISLTGAHVETIVGSGAYPARTSLYFVPTGGTLNLDFFGDVTAAQLEEGQQASSYISAANLPAVRGDEIAEVSLGPWFDPAEGTLVFSGHLDGAVANDRLVEVDSGVTSTRLSLLWNTVLGKPQLQVWDSGILQAAIAPPGNSVQLGSPFRVAIAFGQNDFAVSLNGSGTANDASGAVPAGLSALRLGRSLGGAQGLMTVESVNYFPMRLSDGELQALSA